MSDLPERCCDNCHYMVQVTPEEDQCHRGAPVPMIIYLKVPEPEPELVKAFGKPRVTGPTIPPMQMISTWPKVMPFQWCGEWKHKVEAVREAIKS